MKRIIDIDRNFRVETDPATGLVWRNVRDDPFAVCGVFYENGRFRRLPEAVAKSVSDGVYGLHVHTAGGRVRFRTDSARVAIRAKMRDVGKMPHFALTGSAGFDLYADGAYAGSFVPPFDVKDGYESEVRFPTAEPRELTVHFPLYSGVSELLIGLEPAASLAAAAPYRAAPPVVYYGSSITQGGCASRPGTAYQALLARRLNTDFVNLGFSGSAKGEPEIVSYVCALEASVFVLDYDHNAPTPAHLAATHAPFYRAFRAAHPAVPVVLLSRPKRTLTADDRARRDIVRRTFDDAVAAGDGRVYFLDGPALMALAGDEGTVDDCHPTDLGFFSMAAALEPVLRAALEKYEEMK